MEGCEILHLQCNSEAEAFHEHILIQINHK